METPFLQYLESIPDPRTGNAIRHKLVDILFIAIVATLSGVTEWVHVATYAKKGIDYFKEYLELPHGIPSHDTFGRVFSALSPQNMETTVRKIIRDFFHLPDSMNISIDGKIIRCVNAFGKEYSACIITAYENDSGLILGQIKVDSKENEIVAIPKLLKSLDIKNLLFP